MSNEFFEAARRLFGDFSTLEALDAAERGVFPHALWEAINDSGFGLVLVPEEQGGIGGDLMQAAAILQAAGECAAPGPLLELILGQR